MHTQHNDTCVVTCSGRILDLFNPRSDSIDMADIAHGLSLLSRFGGHALQFYSVAQHCCMVADLVPAEDRLAALLHAAPSAYLGEVIRPLQRLLPEFIHVETRLWKAISEHFGISTVEPDSVAMAKRIAAATERMDLLHAHMPEWALLHGVTALDGPIEPWSSSEAQKQYLSRLIDEVQGTRSRTVETVSKPRPCSGCEWGAQHGALLVIQAPA
jgi:hypothetical protein